MRASTNVQAQFVEHRGRTGERMQDLRREQEQGRAALESLRHHVDEDIVLSLIPAGQQSRM